MPVFTIFRKSSIGNQVARFWSKALLMFVIGFCNLACKSQKTNDLIPENCVGIIQLDLPRLVPKLLANRPVLDSITSMLGLPLESMGINFFQPAYIFQENEDSPVLLLGALSDSQTFKEVLTRKFKNATTTTQGEYFGLWTGNLHLIWNKDFFFVKTTDPILGIPDLDSRIKNWFQPKEKPNPDLNELADFQGFWNINRDFLGGIIPPVEMKMAGKANWTHPEFSIDISIEEHQYLALLKPFPKAEPTQDQNIRLVIWPAIESILLQLDSYGGNAYKEEMNNGILRLLSKMDQPFVCQINGKKPNQLLEQIQISTRYTNLETGGQLEKEVNNMLPGSILKEYALSEKGGTLVFHHQSHYPDFSFPYLPPKTKQDHLVSLSMEGTDFKTQIDFKLEEPGQFKFTAKTQHPEKLRGQPVLWELLTLDPEVILSRFMPNSNEPNP